MAKRRRRDRGTVTTELAIIFPMFVTFALIVIVAGSIAQGQLDVKNAAQEGARAATLERTAGAAAAVGRATALSQVSNCGSANATVDVSAFEPGGVVSVTVECTVTAPLGQTRHMSATAAEVVDTYRSDE